MDGNIQKALWLGVSILLFIAVVAIGMSLYSRGAAIAREGGDELDNTAKQLSASQYAVYDNKEVSGSDVIDAINKYKLMAGEIQVNVTTGGGTTTTYISTGSASNGGLTPMTLTTINTMIKASQNKSAPSTYINPYGSYYATLVYDVNDTIRAIDFVQQ